MAVRTLLGGDLLVSFSYLLTGELIRSHELIGVYFQPLNENLENYLEPFTVKMKPIRERQSGDFNHNQSPFIKYENEGLPPIHSKNLFDVWFDNLNLGYNNHGDPCKIILLTKGFADVKYFMYQWLGEVAFYKYFRGHHRDIETILGFKTDVEAYDLRRATNLDVSLMKYCLSENITHEHQNLISQRADLYRRIYRSLVRKA